MSTVAKGIGRCLCNLYSFIADCQLAYAVMQLAADSRWNSHLGMDVLHVPKSSKSFRSMLSPQNGLNDRSSAACHDVRPYGAPSKTLQHELYHLSLHGRRQIEPTIPLLCVTSPHHAV